MSEINVKLGGDNSEFRGMVDNSIGYIDKFGQSFKDLIPVASAALVVGFFKSVAEEAGKLQDLADRLQVSTEALQAFDFAVKQAGGNSEQAAMVWDKSRKAIDELVAGSEPMIANFAKINLTAADFLGLNYEQALEKIARAYSESADQAGAYAAVIEILGAKAAPKLMAAIKDLSEKGFPGLKKSFDGMMNPEAVSMLDGFGDSIARIGAVAKNAVANGIAGFMQALQNIADVPGKALIVLNGYMNGVSISFDEAYPKAEKAAEAIAKVGAASTVTAAELQKLAKASADAFIKQAQDAVDVASGIEKVNALIELETRLRMQSTSVLLDQKAKMKYIEDADKAHIEMLKEQNALGKTALEIEAKKAEDNIKQMDAKDKLIAKAIQQAKAEAAVLDEFESQLEAIQKMAGMGKGGFKAGPNGGAEGKTTVDALQTAADNAKKAFEYIQKDPNAKDYAKHYVEAQQALDETQKNLQIGKNAQGINSDGTVSIDLLNFSSVQANANAAFGGGENQKLQQKLIDIAESTDSSIKEIRLTAAAIKENLE